MDREQQIDAIVDGARRARRGPSRTLWIVAAVVGVACAIGFAVAMLGTAEPGSATSAPPSSDTGFVRGLALGIAIGVIAGLAIARHVHSSRSRP